MDRAPGNVEETATLGPRGVRILHDREFDSDHARLWYEHRFQN
jgi:hypothetical protein